MSTGTSFTARFNSERTSMPPGKILTGKGGA